MRTDVLGRFSPHACTCATRSTTRRAHEHTQRDAWLPQCARECVVAVRCTTTHVWSARYCRARAVSPDGAQAQLCGRPQVGASRASLRRVLDLGSGRGPADVSVVAVAGWRRRCVVGGDAITYAKYRNGRRPVMAAAPGCDGVCTHTTNRNAVCCIGGRITHRAATRGSGHNSFGGPSTSPPPPMRKPKWLRRGGRGAGDCASGPSALLNVCNLAHRRNGNLNCNDNPRA